MDPLQSLSQKLNQGSVVQPSAPPPTPSAPKAAPASIGNNPMVTENLSSFSKNNPLAAQLGSNEPKINPEDLVYKTMPRGYTPPRNAPAAPAPAAATPAPSAGSNPAANPPVSSEPPKKGFSFGGLGGGKRLGLIIAAAVLVLAAVAFGLYYFVFRNSASTPVSTNQTTPTQKVQPQSQIDPAWIQANFGFVGGCPANKQTICGDNADPDNDGLTNLEEFKYHTDPNNPDTDGDGIADGDEVHVFNTDPTTAHTAGIAKFTDAGDIKYKYNSKAHANFTDADLVQIAANIKKYGLHQPTITTLGPDLIIFYTNYQSTSAPSTSTGQTSANTSTTTTTPTSQTQDPSVQRDIQRKNDLEAIKQALDLYSGDNASSATPNTKVYPTATAYKTALVPKYLNSIPTDPKTKADYSYSVNNDQTDFALQAQLENTYNGKNKYLCNSSGCNYY